MPYKIVHTSRTTTNTYDPVSKSILLAAVLLIEVIIFH